MRRTKAFVMVKELCGDMEFLAGATSEEIYVNAVFESIDAAVSIINYIMERKNNKNWKLVEDSRILVEAESYRIELQKDTERMRQKYNVCKDGVEQQGEKYRMVLETVKELAKELKKTGELVRELKKALSGTEEEIRKNRQHITELDDWLINSAQNYRNLLECYQIGGDEDE